MFDLHYDLLTSILMRQNDIKNIKEYYKKIYNEKNIRGGIFNLFYMSPKEMKKEINIDYKDIDIIKNLQTVDSSIKKNNLIPDGIKYVYGIEGLDYLKNIEDIDAIYELGVRSVNIVWNNENKFGGGVRGNKNKGLTSLGRELVEKLVEKNIAIDLSHTNEKTFFDIIRECQKLKNKNPKIFASHSNSKKICNVKRNLTDKQILKIQEFNGIIGAVSIKKFCIKDKSIMKFQKEYEKIYIENIKYCTKLLQSTNNIALSSDNMGYYKIEPQYYQNVNIFEQNSIKEEIYKLLKKEFNSFQIEKIMFKNAEKFMNKLVTAI